MSAYDTAMSADTLYAVADMRAHGSSWDATARTLGWDATELRRALRQEPDFEQLYQEAEREVRRETEAEMLLVYRTQLRDTDKATARKAADALAKHIAGERRDRTRLEVEKLRAEIALAKASARRVKVEEEVEPPMDVTTLSPEQVHVSEEIIYARRAADDKAIVWLWGGTHKIGDTVPDPTTDVPLAIYGDDTVPGQRQVFWAIRFPLPGNPMTGPFPVPGAQQPVPDITPEQAQQLETLQTTKTPTAA